MSSDEENVRFNVGASFDSFAEFEEVFEAWKRKTGSSYRIASSEKIKEDQSLVNTFRYRYVVFNCIHYGDPRMRGAGIRPNQNYLSCGCPSTFRLNFILDEECLRIMKFRGDHSGHETTGGSVRSRAAFKRLRSQEKDSTKGEDSDEDYDYAKQLQLVEKLKKEQQQLLSILNSRRQKIEMARFDPPPINRDTADFFMKHCRNDGLLSPRECAELEALSKNLLNRKSMELHHKSKDFSAHQPLQQLQPIENYENNLLL